MNVQTYGYLELPYLSESYLSFFETNGHPTQSALTVLSSNTARTQSQLRIASGLKSTRSQIAIAINAVQSPTRTQTNLRITDAENVRTQIELRIASGLNSTRSQTNLQIAANLRAVRTQTNLRIADNIVAVRTQISRLLSHPLDVLTQASKRINTGLKNTRTNVTRTNISHANCYGYLVDPYLDEVYLGNRVCASLWTQVQRIQAMIIHTQVVRALYNVTRLRILPTFPSRGTSGVNWTQIIGSTTGGDFGLENLNTDIVEQVWRSTSTSATIQCDSEISQGVFLDTLAMLGHNFTTSATVELQGSNSPIFATTPYSQNLFTELNDMYWIEPMLPTTSYRYWRFVINDPTNSDGYLQIGTIIFGSAIIFNGECIVDQVQKRKIHFSDKVKTEGFTNVSNDRALKKAVSFSFKYLNYNLENYSNLSDVVDLVRTSLKALWIPDPRFTSRFAVFGKLSELPVENHLVLGADNDYIDMDITVDESL